MTPKEFYEAVVRMRKHQRAYTRSNGRDKQELRYAKEAETLIDREIARVQLVLKDKMQFKIDF